MRVSLALLSSFALLSACATTSPETRIRNSLMDAGLNRPVASCMAEHMVDRLSMVQLRRLASLAKLRDRRIEELTVDQFLHHVRALRDPEILGVVASAGLGCAIAT